MFCSLLIGESHVTPTDFLDMGCEVVCGALRVGLESHGGPLQDVVHQSCFYLSGAGISGHSRQHQSRLNDDDTIACECGIGQACAS